MSDINQILANIRPLTTAKWDAAIEYARNVTLQGNHEPNREMFKPKPNKYPRWVTMPLLLGLVVILFAAWWVSAGKQILVVDDFLAPLLASDTRGRISQMWANISIIATLLLGEVGTLTFSLIAAIFPGERIGNSRVYLNELIFRIAATISAGIALISNITLTALHTEELRGQIVFAWTFTIVTPLAVLVVGYALERMMLGSLESKAEALDHYNIAYAHYLAIADDPTKSPLYIDHLRRAVLDQLRSISAANKAQIDAAIDATPSIRRMLFERERRRQSWEIEVESLPTGLQVNVGTPAVLEDVAASLKAISERVPLSQDTGRVQNKPNSKVDQAVQYLLANPADMVLAVRDLEAKTGINKNWWGEAKLIAQRMQDTKAMPPVNADQS